MYRSRTLGAKGVEEHRYIVDTILEHQDNSLLLACLQDVVGTEYSRQMVCPLYQAGQFLQLPLIVTTSQY